MTTKKSISSQIEEAVAATWKQGVRVNAAMMTPIKAKQLSEEFGKLIRATTIINPETGGPKVVPDNHPSLQGGPTISVLNTPFGEIKILTSPYCPADSIYVGDEQQLRRMAESTADMYKDKNA